MGGGSDPGGASTSGSSPQGPVPRGIEIDHLAELGAQICQTGMEAPRPRGVVGHDAPVMLAPGAVARS